MAEGDREEFTRWAHARQGHLLRASLLLTGDRQRAEAQAFTAGARIPEPPRSAVQPGGSDWISDAAVQPGILLIPYEPGRQKQCCQVDGWIGPHTVLYDSSSATGTRLVAWDAGTGRFWQVSRLTGVALGEETVTASDAQFATDGAPMPY